MRRREVKGGCISAEANMLIGEIIKKNVKLTPDSSIQSDLYLFKLNDKNYVLKKYKKNENREGEILKRYQHPNIVKCYEWGYHEGWQYLILEYVEGRPLSKGGKLSDNHKYQLYELLNFFKLNGIKHHEFKPEHLIINGDKLTLVDFGCAECPEFPTKLDHRVLKLNEKWSPDDEKAVEMLLERYKE